MRPQPLRFHQENFLRRLSDPEGRHGGACFPEKNKMFSTFTRRAAVAGMLSALLFGSIGSAAAAEPLRVATNAVFPPFEFHDSKTGGMQGYEVDLITAMAKVMGRELKLEQMGFDAIIPAIISGTIDAGASGFSITPERGKRVNFTIPFYQSGLTILIAKGNEGKIKNFDDLKGKKISVQIGTTSQTYAKKIEGVEVSTFNSAGDAILNLVGGNCDAVINDKPVTDYILALNKSLAEKTVHLPVLATADNFAMVTAKDNKALCDEMNAAMRKLKADGTFDKIYEKWFGRAPEPELLK